MSSTRQANERLVHQGCRVKRPRLSFAAQVRRGELFQLVIEQRDDDVEGVAIATMSPLQELGDLHGRFSSSYRDPATSGSVDKLIYSSTCALNPPTDRA